MTTGLEEMLANIHKLQVNNRRVAREAVSEGADMFAQQLESNTPDDSGVLKSDVMVSGFKGGGQGQIEKDVGYGGSTGWRVKYPDDGTIHQRPQNFKEKTINEMTPKVQELYVKKMAEGLNL
ncbi:HK97-gp10 family putative phage morphogenesis protein [Vagococcus fluvialis]|uniref:HK97-gp10 family putative phage morphogenesis protein n=1 Tax=Vagococcus fluvialis TaxID=2738 RepID=UPI001D0B7E9E|nr:HK97-gp10 family putative phage morphogenesis protein [Vagococcus fluvialis]UDM70661.1 HK97 gp10 family phage protein [Vagococcus fluvialis]UDM78080.1 HK97 gp10 family phage protein [Vagococcus fluvialis]UDM82349.1 HK97 gp10 family phage protein [Vagococcus fluvialis]